MKILKIFGAVVGVHLVAFVLIFANPGCSSTAKQASTRPTAESTGPAPTITVPAGASSDSSPAMSAAPMASSDPSITFDPNTPAISAPRYSPTRPGTPAASAVQVQAVADVTPATTYTVVNGDSLSVIAKKNHLTVKELTAANHLKAESKLNLGQKLLIPGKASAPAMTMSTPTHAIANKPADTAMPAATSGDSAKSANNGAPLTHVVKNGETLGSIARKYQVKQGEIAVANNITNPALIKAGMTLTIPGGWQTPKSTKASSGSSSSATAQPAPAPVAPPPGQDLDAGLKPSTSTEIPVIKIDDGSTPPTKSP
jgi:LysM repeat protein